MSQKAIGIFSCLVGIVVIVVFSMVKSRALLEQGLAEEASKTALEDKAGRDCIETPAGPVYLVRSTAKMTAADAPAKVVSTEAKEYNEDEVIHQPIRLAGEEQYPLSYRPSRKTKPVEDAVPFSRFDDGEEPLVGPEKPDDLD